ncbi:MAG: DUF1385 domain-containing protein [Candidatus Neomarinimicrobiota bacterium]
MKIFFALMKPSIFVGGQAVIEGVMMRVPGAYATAVRDPEGIIRINRHDYQSLAERSRIWKLPVLRGIAGLFEALKIGMATLQWSAGIAAPKSGEAKPAKATEYISTLLALALAVTLFMLAPIWITTRIFDIEKEALIFNLVSGLFRITFFILYLFLISLMQDVKRLFQYHGAEHRVIYNFESGKDMSIATAQSFPTEHPRCGTSFLFVVLISAILVFAVIDMVIINTLGFISIPIRMGFHLCLMPLVAGLSFEFIKISARNGKNIIFRILRAPGLWLQKITTKPPDDEMVEVAMAALEAAFGNKYTEMVGKEYVADAI